ncbi:glycosyltransferase family 4 protein [Halorubellus salinus]|uniref:glycosyltransferase family 4 protein n=1 Tax=Halorubellus salinus TaxID=755309 RepID=UPI001D08A03D|nr:glycosyltransferase family 4 protein [Halorubellus salinus]
MHVLYILGQSSGGLPHYTAELANAVATEHDVTVMKPTTTSADDLFAEHVELLEPFEPLSVSMPALYRREVSPIDFARGFLSYDRVKDALDVDPDLVHETSGLFPQVQLFTHLHGIDSLPFVVTRHEVPLRRFQVRRPSLCVEELLRLAIPTPDMDATIVHTKNQRDALLRHGMDSDDVTVIPHGAYQVFGDYDDIAPEPDSNVVLFFGHVVPQKGIDTLIEAIPIVAETVPDVTLLVAGDGRIPSDVRPTVDEHSEHYDINTEYVPNDRVSKCFERASVVALPYREQEGGTKGHSGALATAISFGKPVVSSRAGEFPELVGDRGCGLTVPSGDPERLAAVITDLLTDDARRRGMAANSRALATELSWDRIADRHVSLYEAVLSEGRPATEKSRSDDHPAREPLPTDDGPAIDHS